MVPVFLSLDCYAYSYSARVSGFEGAGFSSSFCSSCSDTLVTLTTDIRRFKFFSWVGVGAGGGARGPRPGGPLGAGGGALTPRPGGALGPEGGIGTLDVLPLDTV